MQLEVERQAEGGVAGRFFVKQDRRAHPGYAHSGIIAVALDEAMGLLLHDQGTFALTGRLEIDLRAPAPVGSFVRVEADVDRVEGRRACMWWQGPSARTARRSSPGHAACSSSRCRSGSRRWSIPTTCTSWMLGSRQRSAMPSRAFT